MNRRRIVPLLVVALSGLSGCSNRPVSDSASVDKKLDAIVSESTSSTVETINQQGLYVSPADKAPSTPEDVVRQYLSFVRDGQTSDAEKLLSKVAMLNFKKAEVQMESPGSAAARYELSPPRFATNEQKLALVECQITDQVDAEPVTTSLSWMVRKDSAGWRIIGMMVNDEQNAQQFLSFENVEDVDYIKQNILADDM